MRLEIPASFLLGVVQGSTVGFRSAVSSVVSLLILAESEALKSRAGEETEDIFPFVKFIYLFCKIVFITPGVHLKLCCLLAGRRHIKCAFTSNSIRSKNDFCKQLAKYYKSNE